MGQKQKRTFADPQPMPVGGTLQFLDQIQEGCGGLRKGNPVAFPCAGRIFLLEVAEPWQEEHVKMLVNFGESFSRIVETCQNLFSAKSS